MKVNRKSSLNNKKVKTVNFIFYSTGSKLDVVYVLISSLVSMPCKLNDCILLLYSVATCYRENSKTASNISCLSRCNACSTHTYRNTLTAAAS